MERQDNLYTIRQRNYFKVGDKIEIITPNMDIINLEVKNLYNEKMERIEVANQADSILKMELDMDIPIYSMLRKPYIS